MAAFIRVGENAAHLVDRGDRAAGEVLQRGVDGIAFAERQVTCLSGELTIGANTTTVDDGVEGLIAALVRAQRPEPWMISDRARGADILGAVVDQSSKLLRVKNPMQHIFVLAPAGFPWTGHLAHQQEPLAIFLAEELQRLC